MGYAVQVHANCRGNEVIKAVLFDLDETLVDRRRHRQPNS